MLFLQSVGALTCFFSLLSGVSRAGRPLELFPSEPNQDLHKAAVNTSTPSTSGIMLFRMFDVLDAYGPTKILQYINSSFETDIIYIDETMEPVTTRPTLASTNPLNDSVYPLLAPTHAFETAPELDVLIIPGGPGWRNPSLNATLNYIRMTALKVKQVIIIYTGSALAT